MRGPVLKAVRDAWSSVDVVVLEICSTLDVLSAKSDTVYACELLPLEHRTVPATPESLLVDLAAIHELVQGKVLVLSWTADPLLTGELSRENSELIQTTLEQFASTCADVYLMDPPRRSVEDYRANLHKVLGTVKPEWNHTVLQLLDANWGDVFFRCGKTAWFSKHIPHCTRLDTVFITDGFLQEKELGMLKELKKAGKRLVAIIMEPPVGPYGGFYRWTLEHQELFHKVFTFSMMHARFGVEKLWQVRMAEVHVVDSHEIS